MNFDKDAFTHGPIRSKIWMCDELRKFNILVDNAIVLGGWSGTGCLLLDATGCIQYHRMILVDINDDYLAQSRVICNAIETDGKFTVTKQDANKFEYPVGSSIIINTSTDNMYHKYWFDRIPTNSWVVLQGRSGTYRDSVNTFETLVEFHSSYQLKTTHFVGEKQFRYPDHSYTRFMKIGIK